MKANLILNLKKQVASVCAFASLLVEVIDEKGSYIYGDVDEARAAEILEKHIQKSLPITEYVVKTNLFDTKDKGFFEGQVKIALRNCGYMDPESIEEYEARDGYKAIKSITVKKITPVDVIQTVLDSGLRGRGGGGFPTGLKWRFANNNKAKNKVYYL